MTMSDITRILTAIEQGDSAAADQLLPLVYEELRKLAAHRMANEAAGQTLQPTALVHEAWLRLVGEQNPKFANRAHFFAAAAEAMRRILIDHARARAGPKRGGGRRRVPLNNVLDLAGADEQDLPEILALDDAVSRLEQVSPSVGAVVRLRAGQSLGKDELP